MNIGLLTAGGDCAGLNAAIRAVVRVAVGKGIRVIGIKNGWQGALEGEAMMLDSGVVSGILPLGGTILGASRANPEKIADGFKRILNHFKNLGIDVLVALGGDGTLRSAFILHQQGFPVIGIPKTMDNDVYGTDYSIGFHSAVSVVMDAADKLHTTAMAHHRVMILEVMGRTTGWVGLMGGLAGGADWIMIPEVPASIEGMVEHFKQRKANGKDFSIVVVSEGVLMPEVPICEEALTDRSGEVRYVQRNIGAILSTEIEARTGFETRVTVLGHLQRVGSPTFFDRLLATRLSVAAVEQAAAKKTGIMVALQGNSIGTVPLEEVIKNSPRKVNLELYDMARLIN